jgi:hypothetical protein
MENIWRFWGITIPCQVATATFSSGYLSYKVHFNILPLELEWMLKSSVVSEISPVKDGGKRMGLNFDRAK